MKVIATILKRAVKHLPYIEEKKEGNNCQYFIIKKHKHNEKEQEVMHNLRRDTWHCTCKYMTFGPAKEQEKRYCSHIVACWMQKTNWKPEEKP